MHCHGEWEHGRQRFRRRVDCRPRRGYALVSVTSGGFWHGALEPAAPSGEQQDERPFVLGLLLARLVASPLGSPAASEFHQRLRDWSLAEARRAAAQGYLEYETVAAFWLDRPHGLESVDMRPSQVLQQLATIQGTEAGTGVGDRPCQREATACLAEWVRKHGPLPPSAMAVFDREVAERIMQGAEKVFHCVAITMKINRKRLLSASDASRKTLQELRMQLPPTVDAAPLREKRWRGGHGPMRDPDLALDWLDISQDIKQQRHAPIVCHKFARMFAKRSGVTKEKLLSNMQFMAAKTLVKARVRADGAAMLLCRAWWQKTYTSAEVSV